MQQYVKDLLNFKLQKGEEFNTEKEHSGQWHLESVWVLSRDLEKGKYIMPVTSNQWHFSHFLPKFLNLPQNIFIDREKVLKK